MWQDRLNRQSNDKITNKAWQLIVFYRQKKYRTPKKKDSHNKFVSKEET